MTNSTSDFSPEDVRKAQALAPQLDPDIARAITQGNGPVIQAIANGAATDAQIAERLISMGLTTGLPPGVQQMVNEQMQLAADKRGAEVTRSERLDKLASGALGMGLTGGEGNAQTSSSGSSAVKSCATMSFAERTAYFCALAGMSYENYAQQSDSDRQQHIDNVKAEGMAQAVEAKKELEKFPDKLLADPKLGATPEERQAAKERIYAAADYDYNAEGFYKNLEKLSPAEREAAVALRALYYKANFGSNAHDRGNDAQDAKNKGNKPGEHGNVVDGADDLKQINDKIERDKKYLAELNAGTNKLNQLAAAPTVDVGKAAAAYRQSGTALANATESAQTKAEHDKLRDAGDDNLAARERIYASLSAKERVAHTAKQETSLQAGDDSAFDDVPEPPSRKSINCNQLANSGQIALPLPTEHANVQAGPDDIKQIENKILRDKEYLATLAAATEPHKMAVSRPKNDGAVG